MSSRTTALAVGIAAIVTVAACRRPAESRADAAASAAAAASAESGVPAELLLAIAFVESRLSTDGPDHWVRLVRWRVTRDPRRGAALIGVSPDQLDDDPALAMRAAAALLSHAASATRVPRDAPPAAWRPALERFAGGRDPLANRLFADQVITTLSQGFETTDDSGAVVRLPGSTVAHAAEDRFPPRPDDVVGAAFAAYVPLIGTAHRPMSDEPRRPQYIVIHTMQNTLPVILEYFRRSGTAVGAHYLVEAVGRTTVQMADERLVVFHDACFNEASIGIEHEGYVEAGARWYSDELYRASARLVRDVARRHQIPLDRNHILGHGESPDCSDHTDPGPAWDWDRFMAQVRAAD